MILKQPMCRGKRRWRESRCSDLWCRSQTDEQSPSSLNEQIPSTIPKSISDGVSKCSSTPASDASGSRMRTAAIRPRRNTGCLRITSRNSATAVHPSIRQTANAFAVRTTPARRCKQEPRGSELDEGGRGFNSPQIGCPATAPTLMQRFFSRPGSFELFSGIQKFKRRSRRFVQQKQRSPIIHAPAFGHLFSDASAVRTAIRKNVAKFPRGGWAT